MDWSSGLRAFVSFSWSRDFIEDLEMTLRFLRIRNPGDLDKERAVLRAATEVDIGRYALFACFADDEVALSGPIRKGFWFEDKKIKAGDFVVLYSKRGSAGEKVGESGATSYFFYWESNSPIWTNGTIPVLLLAASWVFGPAIK